MTDYVELPVPRAGIINHICHISDIHIRPGTDNKDSKNTRYDEYITVFDRICTFLTSTYKEDDYIICVTGDIFHDNRKAGSSCIELFLEILHKLSACAPVLLIRGNHDYNQASVDDQDMISSFKRVFDTFPNLAYIDKTGLYRAGNVGFGIVVIQDVLKAGNTFGTVENLPTFPDALQMKGVTTRCALFHGSVPDTYPLSWFGPGYDMVLLGDLHTQQVHNVETIGTYNWTVVNGVMKTYSYTQSTVAPVWGYPGSTTQQNHGESLLGHGFLMWNLANKDKKNVTVDAYHVPNRYGFVTTRVSERHGVMISVYKGQYISLENAIHYEWFPSIIRLRIKKHTLDLHNVIQSFIDKGLVVEASNEIVENEMTRRATNDCKHDTIDLRMFNKPATWVNHINQVIDHNTNVKHIWKTWFSNPESIIIQEPSDVLIEHDLLADTIRERNKRIMHAIGEYTKTVESIATCMNNHTSFELCYMDWSYILCFTSACHVNFETLHGQVHCVSGKNGHGKTSFLETICLALFGDGFPSRTSKNSGCSLINEQKPRHCKSYTAIVFRIDNITVRIKRSFSTQADNKLNTKDITLDIMTDGQFVNVHSGKKATNEWLSQHVGSVESFLTSCMITQNCDEDFFHKKSSDQKLYLEQQLRLDSSSLFHNVLKVATLAYEDVSSKYREIYTAYQTALTSAKKLQLSSSYDMTALHDAQQELDSLMKTRSLHDVWKDVNERTLCKGKHVLQEELSQVHMQSLGSSSPESESIEQLLIEKGTMAQQLHLLGSDVCTIDDVSVIDSLLCEHDDAINAHELQKPAFSFSEATLSQEQIDELEQIVNAKFRLLDGNVDIDNAVHKINKLRQSITASEEKLAQLTSSVNDTNLKKKKLWAEKELAKNKEPQQPTISDDSYQTWMRNITEFNTKYQSFDELVNRMNQHCKPSVVPPSMTHEQFVNANHRLQRWYHYAETILSQQSSPTTIKSVITEIIASKSTERMALSCDIQHSKNLMLETNQSIQDAEGSLDVELTLMRRLNEDIPNKPTYNHVAWKKEQGELHKMQNKLKELSSMFSAMSDSQIRNIFAYFPMLNAQHQSLSKQLEDAAKLLADGEKHEFNPDCYACMKHPWKIQRDELYTNASILEATICSIEAEMKSRFGSLLKPDIEWYKLAQDYLALLKEVNDRQIVLNNDEKLASDYAVWSDRQKAVQQKINGYQADIRCLNQSLQSIQHDIHEKILQHADLERQIEKLTDMNLEWSTEMSDLQQAVSDHSISVKEWADWHDVNNRYVQDRGQWSEMLEQKDQHMLEYKLRIAHKEWKNLCDTIEHLLEQLDSECANTMEEQEVVRIQIQTQHKHSAVLQTTHALQLEYNEQVSRLDRANAAYNWQTIHDKHIRFRRSLIMKRDMIQMEQRIKICKEYEASQCRILELKTALDVIDDYEKCKELDTMIHDRRVAIECMSEKLRSSTVHEQEYNLLKDRVDVLSTVYRDMVSMCDTLKIVLDEFGKFKDHILEQSILPLITQHVNALLSIMCTNHRPISLGCTVKQGMFSWYIRDGKNSPSLEKASGFQRFVISLSMRIVLGRLGVAGIKNTQLFIDEGFTACDVDNLNNVPDVLSELLTMYNTIVIVSHLDDLKHGVKSFINIERDSHGSQLNYGNTNPTYVENIARNKNDLIEKRDLPVER